MDTYSLFYTILLYNSYKIYDFYANYHENGTWWPNHNIIINGKLNTKHLIGFIAFACLYAII